MIERSSHVLTTIGALDDVEVTGGRQRRDQRAGLDGGIAVDDNRRQAPHVGVHDVAEDEHLQYRRDEHHPRGLRIAKGLPELLANHLPETAPVESWPAHTIS